MESKKVFFRGSFQDSAVWVSIGLRSKNLFTPISAINPFWDMCRMCCPPSQKVTLLVLLMEDILHRLIGSLSHYKVLYIISATFSGFLNRIYSICCLVSLALKTVVSSFPFLKKKSHNEVICPKIVSKQNEIREDQMAKCIKVQKGDGSSWSGAGELVGKVNEVLEHGHAERELSREKNIWNSINLSWTVIGFSGMIVRLVMSLFLPNTQDKLVVLALQSG